MTSRRVPVAVVIAAAAGLAFGLLEVHRHGWLMRGLQRPELVRLYLTNSSFRHFIHVVERADDHRDVFASIMDTDAGVLLSRHLFRSVDMDGAPRYMYQPNLHKLGFRTGGAGAFLNMETRDLPEIRAALADLETVALATATYDEHGFRRGDPGLAQDCETRVLFLGDSFTDGLWVDDGDTLPNRFARIARSHAGPRVCAINTGVNGYGTPEEAWILEHYFDAVGRPRLVFLLHYPNDITVDDDAVVRGEVPNVDGLWASNLRGLDRIVRFTRSHDAALVLVALPTKSQVFNGVDETHYQDRLRTFAAANGILFVDMLKRLPASGRERFYWTWDPHFTPAGQQAAAQVLYEASLLPERDHGLDPARAAGGQVRGDQRDP